MKAPSKPETKQPSQFGRGIAVELANLEYIGENSVEAVASLIDRHPAVKELVEAAKHMMATRELTPYHCGICEKADDELRSALKAFPPFGGE